MPNRSWTLLNSQDVSDHRIFRLRHDFYRFEPSRQEREFVVIDTASWVNVVPVTAEGNVVLIRQYRHGIQDVVVEIPGGMIDPGEEPEAAAVRELEEETGYTVGSIRPWPAYCPIRPFRTTTSTCLPPKAAARRASARLDAFECIDVFERPLSDIPELIRNGEISHAMIIAAFGFMGLMPKM